MIPIEKAKELLNIFNNKHFPESKEYIIYQSLEESKRCSLIAVYEILSLGKKLPLETLEYYLEVIKEIEKL